MPQSPSMPSAPVPNDRLAALVDILGEAETRELVALFLESFPSMMNELACGDRERERRAAHGLKSSSQQMGAAAVALLMAELEAKLSEPGEGRLSPADIQAAAQAFKESEGPLRAFAAGG